MRYYSSNTESHQNILEKKVQIAKTPAFIFWITYLLLLTQTNMILKEV